MYVAIYSCLAMTKNNFHFSFKKLNQNVHWKPFLTVTNRGYIEHMYATFSMVLYKLIDEQQNTL